MQSTCTYKMSGLYIIVFSPPNTGHVHVYTVEIFLGNEYVELQVVADIYSTTQGAYYMYMYIYRRDLPSMDARDYLQWCNVVMT